MAALLFASAIGVAVASSSGGSLQQRIAAARAGEHALQAGIAADNSKVAGFQGTINDLQARLSALQSSLNVERAQLDDLQGQLRAARARLTTLKIQFVQDQQVLANQLTASYEGDTPDALNVVMSAHGFSDLIERVDEVRLIARENAETTMRVGAERHAVSIQANHLADLTTRQERVTTSVLVQRDEVDRLRLAVVSQQLVFARARNRRASQLDVLRSRRQSLQQQLASIQKREAAAQARSFALTSPGSSGISGGSLAPSGSDGFFPAPGTDYSVGDEPQIAARLNTMGKALHLHLIGISGYRSPQHSVEVGGFANDPHTRGLASDTPGVEGVAEPTLNQFGLTRPFPGPAEADHIQLVGSPL
jgi:peptidoglycan hydrolase CwlO-like protein